jgi:hypothetical protein
MDGARKKKAPNAFAEAQGAAEALGRAIDEANVARERLLRGQNRGLSYEKKLELAALLGRALRSENGAQR